MRHDESGIAIHEREVADEFNHFFSEAVSDIRPTRNQGRVWRTRTIYMQEVLQLEVESLLRRLDVRKSTDPDGISNYVLKSCAGELAPVITLCANKCLQRCRS